VGTEGVHGKQTRGERESEEDNEELKGERGRRKKEESAVHFVDILALSTSWTF
jgi:hypothetical protein